MKWLAFTVLLLLPGVRLRAEVPSAGDQFAIISFSTTDRVYEKSATDIIQPLPGSDLQETRIIPALRPGEIIMRKKYNQGEYRLYKGLIDTAAFSREPPLYSYKIPGWATLSDMIRYKIYQAQSDNPSTDKATVYFDNERIYLQHFRSIFYYRNNIWFELQGYSRVPRGNLKLVTEPSGARVVINGMQTGQSTPCTFENMFAGVYEIEVFLPDYRFFRKTLRVRPDSTTAASFELMSDFDTIYIAGNVPFGLLMLPSTPLDIPFVIDGEHILIPKIRLKPGKHHLSWNGGDLFGSIDTTITIPAGKVIYFDHLFRRRFGTVRVMPFPFGASVCLNQEQCVSGEKISEIPAGFHLLKVYHRGYETFKEDVYVNPDSITTIMINLRARPDRDGDGFTDSSDRCPDRYGLFDGCPRRRTRDAINDKHAEIRDYVEHDPFSVGFSLIGLISRIPTRKVFSNFLSAFSSGKIGGVNNYRGLTLVNSLHLSWRGLYASADLGQWSAGLQYHRSDTLYLKTASSEHLIFYDSIAGVEPLLLIPSTSVSLGFHYAWKWFNVIYALGYQWEDIIIDKIYNTGNGEFDRVTFDNDWWFHQINLEADLHVEEMYVPSIYLKFKFPFATTLRTRWHVMQIGTQLKVLPRSRKAKKR